MSDLFTIITKEEYENPRQDIPPLSGSAGEVVDSPVPTSPVLTWCEFCKGHYIEEFHVERKE